MGSFQTRALTLSRMSVERHNSAFSRFDWPNIISEQQWWQSPDALTLAGTEEFELYSEQQKMQLAKWECVNVFSLNYTGEMELIQEVSQVMNEIKLAEAKEYLHHLLDEENQHMWYFNKFCTQYAGKCYPNKKMRFETPSVSANLRHFLVFARILIFEEIGHYFNLINARDTRVHEFVREINQAHSQDEARHITFGRQLLEHLAEAALNDESDIAIAEQELQKTIILNIGALYNPAAYRDAGIEKGVLLRERLLNHPQRIAIHEQKMLVHVRKLLVRCGLTAMQASS